MSVPPSAASPEPPTETHTSVNEKGEKVWTVGTLAYTKRGLVVLFAWLLWGDFCWTMMEAVVPSILPLKLRSLESPNVLIGLILTSLPAALNIGITPALSFKSDRHRGPLGRRTPFILYTVPFLALTMILIAYSDSLGGWVNRSFLSGDPANQAKVVILLLAIFAAAFDFFNMFVYTVYWYLFADVVPKAFMGRFMSWFRLVGIIASFLYNFFVFPYAMSHMREIYIGGALIYLIGFGIVCLRVKEGQYPPPEDIGKKPSLLDQIKVYARECYTSRYYWDINLGYAFAAMAGCIGWANVFMLRSLGLNLTLIGRASALGSIVVPICLLFTGSLVDRWNAVRVNAYLACYGTFFAFGGWVWLFIDNPPPMLFFWISIGGALFSGVFSAMSTMIEIPRLIELFPRDRFGQFSGAIALCRGPAGIIGGIMGGYFLDIFLHFYPKAEYGEYAYRFGFLWSAPLTVLSFYFNYRVYRAWKRLGAEKSFVPPDKPFKLRQLPPRPDDTGKVPQGLILVIAIAWLGGLLGGFVWWGYYAFFTTDIRAAVVLSISLTVHVLLFMGYLLFVRMMERP
jgi:MFS family permease